MAAEDTNKISTGIDPVQQQVRVSPKKDKPKISRDTVSSPAPSVEDRIKEKTQVDSQGVKAGEHSSFQKSAQSKSGAQETEPITRSKLEEITEGINVELSFLGTSVQFEIEEVDTESSSEQMRQGNSSSDLQIKKKEIVVSVVDKRTGEVIRKIPPEDLLQSLYNASMFLGLLIDQII